RQLVVAAEVVAAAQLLRDAELVEVHRELGHVGAEPRVLHEQARHHLLELAALLGRHALHERLHARRLPRDLVEQLVEALDAREVLPPLLLERVEVGLVAFRALAQHAVDVAQHLAHPLHVVGAHAVERLLHPLHERLHHLLLQRLHQLLELPLGVLVGEVVVLELLDPAGRLGRELVEGVELPGALPRLLDLTAPSTARFDHLLASRARIGWHGSLTTSRPVASPLYEFGGGFPDPASFPYDGMVEATASMMKAEGAEALTYGDHQGYRGM